MALSLGGLVSFYFSSHIRIPDIEAPLPTRKLSITAQAGDYLRIIRQEKAFTSFVTKRLIFLTGVGLSAPLFPLYYVRVVDASEAWIGIISTAQTAVLIIGYFIWMQQSRRAGSHRVLVVTTFGTSLYPILVALTHRVELIALLAGVNGIFQAGLDLIFFDELMRTVPPKSSATFVAFAQSLQYFSNIVAPLVGALLADSIGLSGALLVSAAIRIVGVALFAFGGKLDNPSLSEA
jgi:MFS family permease